MNRTKAERLLAAVVKTWQGDDCAAFLRAIEKALAYLKRLDRAEGG